MRGPARIEVKDLDALQVRPDQAADVSRARGCGGSDGPDRWIGGRHRTRNRNGNRGSIPLNCDRYRLRSPRSGLNVGQMRVFCSPIGDRIGRYVRKRRVRQKDQRDERKQGELLVHGVSSVAINCPVAPLHTALITPVNG